MKELWKSGVLILLVIGVLYIIFLRECKHPLPCPPKGQVLLPQSTWDSILALANKPPEIKRDTIWEVRDSIIYVVGQPLPDPSPDVKDSTINSYTDSLVRKSIHVYYDFKVKGTLLDRTWRYSPVTTFVSEVKTIYVPKVVLKETIVKQPTNGLYLYGVAGGNMDSFIFGGGADYITKKETELGYMYQRFGDVNFHSIKVGTKINFKRLFMADKQ